MNQTQKAIAATFYRLISDTKMRLKDVPDVYRKDVSNYKKSLKGLIPNEEKSNRQLYQQWQGSAEVL